MNVQYLLDIVAADTASLCMRKENMPMYTYYSYMHLLSFFLKTHVSGSEFPV